MSLIRFATLSAVTLIFVSGSARAEFLTFTDEASFLAAVTGPEGESEAPAAMASSTGDELKSSGGSGQGDPVATTNLAGGYSGPNVFFRALTYHFIGVGGWFRRNAGGPLTVDIDDTPVHTFWPPIGEYGFWGVVRKKKGFRRIRFRSDEEDDWGANNFTFAHSTAVVPEPASCTLFGIGAFGLVGFGVRRRRRQLYTAA